MLNISEAAALLEVSEATLRRWDANGKFRARRHPVNDYRMYRRRDVTRLRDQIARGVRPAK